MSTFKRSALIACVSGLAAAAVLFCVILWAPAGLGVAGALRDVPVLLGLASLVALVALVGAVWGVVRLVQALTHAAARLSDTQTGTVFIEKSALVSVVAGALAQIPHVGIQSISVDVIARHDTSILDVEVTASPLGTDSLMHLAGAIQQTTKDALEAFTEHEVRYVAVKFVEPRRHGEPMSAGAKPASPQPAKERVTEDLPTSAWTAVAPAESGDAAEEGRRPATEHAEAPESVGMQERRRGAASLWERARAAVRKARGRVDGDQNVVPTPATIIDEPKTDVDVATPGCEDGVTAGAADARAAEPTADAAPESPEVEERPSCDEGRASERGVA